MVPSQCQCEPSSSPSPKTVHCPLTYMAPKLFAQCESSLSDVNERSMSLSEPVRRPPQVQVHFNRLPHSQPIYFHAKNGLSCPRSLPKWLSDAGQSRFLFRPLTALNACRLFASLLPPKQTSKPPLPSLTPLRLGSAGYAAVAIGGRRTTPLPFCSGTMANLIAGVPPCMSWGPIGHYIGSYCGEAGQGERKVGKVSLLWHVTILLKHIDFGGTVCLFCSVLPGSFTSSFDGRFLLPYDWSWAVSLTFGAAHASKKGKTEERHGETQKLCLQKGK